MNLTEYQKEALKTRSPFWIEPKGLIQLDRANLIKITAAAAIAGEAGELLNKIKKAVERGDEFPIEQSIDELGDVLWYVANLAEILLQNPYALDTVANSNILKLRHRHGEKFDPTELAFRDGSTTIDSGFGGQIGGPDNNPQINPDMDSK